MRTLLCRFRTQAIATGWQEISELQKFCEREKSLNTEGGLGRNRESNRLRRDHPGRDLEGRSGAHRVETRGCEKDGVGSNAAPRTLDDRQLFSMVSMEGVMDFDALTGYMGSLAGR